ncbi:MAG: hypothetical protein M1531_03860 [Chloroflexi bacterium]|nr:hypothetical protein [Chloroflexota bacterium]
MRYISSLPRRLPANSGIIAIIVITVMEVLIISGLWLDRLKLDDMASSAPLCPLSATLRFDVRTLDPAGGRPSITARIRFAPSLPTGYDIENIDPSTLQLYVEGGTPGVKPDLSSVRLQRHGGYSASELHVTFRQDEVIRLLEGRTAARVFVGGTLANGCQFEGRDTLLLGPEPVLPAE